MSKNAIRNTPIPTVKKTNQLCLGRINYSPTPTTHPTRFGCIAYVTGFDIRDQHFVRASDRFVKIIRKAEAIPAWKSPTLRSSHTLW